MSNSEWNEFGGGKRYNTLDGFLKKKFGCKVAKISLNAGFTCPNRDGTKGYGGCIYCSDKLSGEFAGKPSDSIESQMEYGKAMMSKKWKKLKYMPYFQAGTNTYAPTEKLRTLFEQALGCEDVVGLSIATRPDCISDSTYAYLEELAGRTFLTVELGLQSVFDCTGDIINRCTSYKEFLDCFTRLKNSGISVCVHLINGLPGETKDMMLESVQTVSLLKPWSVKLHLLHVIKGTVCEKMFAAGEFDVMEKDEYVNLVCDELERIDKSVVIQRLTGDGARDTLVAPLWSLKKFEVLNAIDKELEKRDSFQGKYV